MRKIEIWQYLVALIAILLLTGCVKESRITDHGISKQEAIDVALKMASLPRPEISGSQVTPSNVNAEKMTLGEATKRISGSNDVAAGYARDMSVWVVTMDGIWLDEFPRPTDLPTPVPYQHFIIVIDAKSGLEIESAARP